MSRSTTHAFRHAAAARLLRFTAALPESQPLATYLTSLGAAADVLRRRGGKVSAALLLLDTRP